MIIIDFRHFEEKSNVNIRYLRFNFDNQNNHFQNIHFNHYRLSTNVISKKNQMLIYVIFI
jgi:hypothetical protein